MKKRGVTTFVFVTGVIALVLAVVIIIYLGLTTVGSGGFKNFFEIIIPGFGKGEVRGGDSEVILGLDLRDNELKYYDGNKWANFGKDEMVEIKGKEINKGKLRELLYGYYYNTERKGPTRIFISDNLAHMFLLNNKIYSLSGDFQANEIITNFDSSKIGVRNKGTYVYAREDNNYAKKGEEIKDIFLDQSDNIYFVDYTLLSGFYLSKINNLGDYSRFISYASSWRDQIVKGESCEEYLEIEGRDYHVEKIGLILIIDLDNLPQGNSLYSSGCPYVSYSVLANSVGGNYYEGVFYYNDRPLRLSVIFGKIYIEQEIGHIDNDGKIVIGHIDNDGKIVIDFDLVSMEDPSKTDEELMRRLREIDGLDFKKLYKNRGDRNDYY